MEFRDGGWHFSIDGKPMMRSKDIVPLARRARHAAELRKDISVSRRKPVDAPNLQEAMAGAFEWLCPQSQPAARPLEILEAALAILREGGFETFSMRRVAERSDLSLAAIQYHFATRADLIMAMIELRLQWYAKALSAQLVQYQSRPPKEQFLMAVDWLLDDVRHEPSSSFAVQLWAFVCFDAHANAALDRFMFAYRAFLATLMLRLNPRMSEREALTRGAAISALIDGTIILVSRGRLVHPEYGDLRATARAMALHQARAAPASTPQ